MPRRKTSPACETCGEKHVDRYGNPACPGHRKQARGGGPCRAPAGRGTSHLGHGLCAAHGGNTPGGIKQGQQQMAQAAAATYGLPLDVDPTQALLEEIARTNGHIHWIAERIQRLAPDGLIWGLTKTEIIGASEFTGVNNTEQATIHVWLELYHRERKHLTDVCAKAIAAGIAERQVRLAEAQGRQAFAMFQAALDAAELDEEQRTRVYDELRRQFVRPAA